MGKDALVVPRDVLFSDGEFQGFLPLEQRDLISLIIANHIFHPRGEGLESNRDLQQIIPYVWIVNPLTRKVFLYRRTLNNSKKAGEFVEKRYFNNYSGGVGGHIDRDTEEGADDPIFKAMMRELREEVEMSSYPAPRVLGYLNDDADDLGRVHFGVLAVAETTGDVKARQKQGLGEGAFYSVEEVDRIFSVPENEVENWTRISWPYVRSYIESLK